jgi:hypothetical protein
LLFHKRPKVQRRGRLAFYQFYALCFALVFSHSRRVMLLLRQRSVIASKAWPPAVRPVVDLCARVPVSTPVEAAPNASHPFPRRLDKPSPRGAFHLRGYFIPPLSIASKANSIASLAVRRALVVVKASRRSLVGANDNPSPIHLSDFSDPAIRLLLERADLEALVEKYAIM